ncbi:MAG: serine/threonine protein kinase [Verrucomicrobia bacterium]|nr:serine/threonine protein kinase [Verrucomicrobiota bacterium]
MPLRSFGDFELLNEIGRGGMGVVYKARQRSLDRIVAVKMILSGPFARKESVQRFRAETETAAQLQHPNIVAIHEVGEFDGRPYFSMDYVEGKSLAELVRDNPLSAKRAVGYVKTIAEGIQYAHERGIPHRDLKPSNVLIDAYDRPRVTDFGLAKRLPVESRSELRVESGSGTNPGQSPSSQLKSLPTELTLTGQVLGSPNYLPPEQAGAKRGSGKAWSVGAWSDVYGLGTILYHLLSGRPPFHAETPTETLHLVLTSEPVSPRLLNPGVPRDLETLVSPDGTTLACAGDFARGKGVIRLWRFDTRTLFPWFHGHKGGLRSVVFSPDGTRLASGSYDQTVKLWEVATGRLLADLTNHTGAAECVRFSPNGKLLASGDRPDGTVRIWDVEDAVSVRELASISGPRNDRPALAFSRDDKTFAFGVGDGAIQMWDLNSMSKMAVLPRHVGFYIFLEFSGHSGWITSLAMSPDVRSLASTATDGTLKLWNLEIGKEVATLGPVAPFSSVTFSPDGNTVATRGGEDGIVRLWHAVTFEEAEREMAGVSKRKHTSGDR